MNDYLLVFMQSLDSSGAAETLRDLSPWAYVIVILSLSVAGVFYRLYVKEKEHRNKLEEEFRTFMSQSLTQQIQVSKDVIDLVNNSKVNVDQALSTFHDSDTRIESLISEMKNQLSSIESHITRINR